MTVLLVVVSLVSVILLFTTVMGSAKNADLAAENRRLELRNLKLEGDLHDARCEKYRAMMRVPERVAPTPVVEPKGTLEIGLCMVTDYDLRTGALTLVPHQVEPRLTQRDPKVNVNLAEWIKQPRRRVWIEEMVAKAVKDR